MQGIISVQIVEMIKTETVVGVGTENNPVRTVVQYWDKQENLICTKDDYLEVKKA